MREEVDLLFGLLFVAWWFIILKCLSVYTGWSRLAEEFVVKGKFSGKVFRCQSVGSRGATHVGVNDAGLYLALLFPFRPFHKPLFIPWERIKFVRGRQLLFSGYHITVDSYPGIKFFFSERTYRRLAAYIPSGSKPVSD